MPKRPTAKQIRTAKAQRTAKAESDYKNLNYGVEKIKTIGEERGRLADMLRARNQGKKKKYKKAKDCAPGEMFNKHMKKKNKLFGLFGKKTPKKGTKVFKESLPKSAPAQFKGRMNGMKKMIDEI